MARIAEDGLRHPGRRAVTVQSAQTTLVIAYAIPWPAPRVRSALTTLLTAYEILWGTNEIRAAQVTMVIVHDLTPPPAEGPLITMLCQIVSYLLVHPVGLQ